VGGGGGGEGGVFLKIGVVIISLKREFIRTRKRVRPESILITQ